MIDSGGEAFAAEGIRKVGVPVIFQRLSGYAPNVTTVSSPVIAKVLGVLPDTTEESQTGYSASKPGSISQDDRLVLVQASALAAAVPPFPLPVKKGDRVVLDPNTHETGVVTKVDYFKRALTGTIEVTVSAVA